MKRTLLIISITILMIGMCAGIFSNASQTSSDPSDYYVPQIAEYEDSSIDLWFEHSFKKVMTSDITPSDMNTYSVYMGKNETENAQFVLYSDETKTKLRASISDFTDENGNTVDAEIYYQMYVTLDNVNTTGYIGATQENTFLRNGEQPDPVVPMSAINLFKLNGGKSQAFYIRLKTTEDSKSGWYSAQLNIKNAMNQVVKTATVYAYVWDFVIEDKPALQTSFYMGNKPDQYGSYEIYYNYLLENRINAMDVPGELNSSNPYLTDDRVGAIRVTYTNGGNSNTYMESSAGEYYRYADIYTDLSSMKEWDSIKDKFYFYTADEPMSKEHQDRITGTSGHTVDDVKKTSEYLAKYWPNAATVVPYHENHPYPYYTYEQTMASLDTSLIKDSTQEMIDSASCTVWCPHINGFTPSYELEARGYTGTNIVGRIRNLSATISGNILKGEAYYNWEALYGDFADRVISNNIVRNRDGQNNDRLWAYTAGWGQTYTYAHHMIEHTGLQTKMLFWQLYQNDVTGYLYYDVNKWGGDYVDKTVTGDKTGAWKVNTNEIAGGYTSYSSGILFYQAIQGGFTKDVQYVGSIRVEQMRDGIEEYQMLTMLDELKGNAAADAIVDSVSKNVANYLSLPVYDRSAFDSSMDDYDVMAMTRIRLGNELEEATKQVCQHQYGEGKVTKSADCLTMGEMTYTCADCGAVKTEYIPTLHAEGDCFDVTEEKAATCTTSGQLRYDCTICGYTKYVTVSSHHSNPERLKYEVHDKMLNSHNVICTVCKATVKTETHTNFAEYTNTCTDAGQHNNVCKLCGYVTKVKDVDAKGHYLVETYVAPTCQEEGYRGEVCQNCDYTNTETLAIVDHNYVDGKCTMCGDSLVVKGDVDGDGEVSPLDYFQLKLILAQKITPTEEQKIAANVDGSQDPDPNMLDSFAFKFYLAKGYWAN